MNKPLLSICIPTYNQADKLEQFLISVKSQTIPGIEIVIQDDSTNDETKKLVERVSLNIPIRYFGRHYYFHKNKESIEQLNKGERGGIDRSIIFLTQEARGMYVWWMGDDVLKPGAIKNVVSLLNMHSSIIFIWVNHQVADSGILALDLGSDHFFKDRNEILEQVVSGLGFISATIFKKEKALTGIEGSKRYIGTAFVNLYIVLHILAQEGKYYYLRGPYCTSYLNKPDEVNNNGFEVFGVYFYRIIQEFQKKFNTHSIKRVLEKNFGSVWRGMLVRWVTGYESPRGKRWKMVKLYWMFPECWIALPIMVMPLWVNKKLYKTYKLFFSERKWRGFKR